MFLEENLVKINPKLWNYLEVEIFPQYAQNDAGHRIDHIEYVMRRSIDFADYVEKHEEISVQMLENDQTIRNFLTPNELKVAARAIRKSSLAFF